VVVIVVQESEDRGESGMGREERKQTNFEEQLKIDMKLSAAAYLQCFIYLISIYCQME
jgi:hypothetical protein